MRGHRSISILLFLCVVIMTMSACGEKPAPPAPQANAVRTKIDSKPAGQPAVPAKQTAATEDVKNTQAPDASKATEESSDLIKASMAIASTYDPTGRFDPFEPLFKEEPQAEPQVASKTKRKKRVPQTPLERVALSQLKVSAIIRAPSGNRALVEDATGKGYVVINGTYMGLNAGKVVKIEKDRIVVEEEIENVLGELTVKNTELKLQKPAGEL